MGTEKDTPNIRVFKGGKFELAEMIERNTYINEDGDKVVHLSPELFDMMRDDKLCGSTRSLSKKEIADVCEFYKGKFMTIVDPDTVEEIVDEDGEIDIDDSEAEIIEMSVHHMEYDKDECIFTVYAENAFRFTHLGIYNVGFREEDSNLIIVDIPQEYNNAIISCDERNGVLIDIVEFMETLQGNIETLAVEFNYENQCFDKLWKQLKKMEAKSNNKNGNGTRKPRRSKQKSSSENNDKSAD